MASVDELITGKEAELESARAAVTATWGQPAGTSRMRGKQHGARIDSQLRRDAQNAETVQRLERELAALRNQQTAPAPVDLSRLPYARFVRTRYGWFEMVRVNRATVKVLVAPGMDDRIPIKKIVEIREGGDE